MVGGSALDPSQRLRLQWATRQASEHGSPLRLNETNLEDIAASVVEPHPPYRKLDELLLMLGRRTPAFGKPTHINRLFEWPLVYARGQVEFEALIQSLADETKFIRETRDGIQLTREGWERFGQLDAERPRSTTAFVAMWFNDAMRSVYDSGFYPALYGLGYDPIRVDREHYLGKIDDFIIASIRKSTLLVADFTGMRTGVFFEAGLGLGLGIPVVWTCRADSVSKLADHFDTRQYNHLVWTEPADLAVKLRVRIEAAVTSRPKPRVHG
jgi:hypothetical protein